MLQVQRAGDRYPGGDPAAGIDTRHAFSFSGHYDPDNTGFGLLVACNEERLAPGAGFDEHPHRDLEIVSWVLEGELTHEDSTGRTTTVRPGDLQRLSAGSGVRHVERNAGGAPLRFLQMWLVPGVFGRRPAYEVVRDGAVGTGYALPDTDARLSVHRPRAGERVTVPPAPFCYLHAVAGRLTISGAESATLAPGDAARLRRGPEPLDPWGPTVTTVTAEEDAEFLLWEMGGEPAYG
ncbi:pirin family protein [Streptomyces durbertensis]|uniref:Pirin family protein n=1 Tax=Streptomyces durbertensis TaxID=2448886 RepID=A0ABR6EFR5_9ACTN|nr:pirin-like bicupin family protein [Streptomyces durbertensis]MBB1244176.1 pirin family protein [Streptomyces durbertensis]